MTPLPRGRNSTQLRPRPLASPSSQVPHLPLPWGFAGTSPSFSSLLPRWCSASCGWAQEEPPPSSTCRRVAALPHLPGLHQRGAGAIRAKGVVTEDSELDAGRSPGSGGRMAEVEGRSPSTAYLEERGSSCRCVNEIPDPQSLACSFPFPQYALPPAMCLGRQGEACS